MENRNRRIDFGARWRAIPLVAWLTKLTSSCNVHSASEGADVALRKRLISQAHNTDWGAGRRKRRRRFSPVLFRSLLGFHCTGATAEYVAAMNNDSAALVLLLANGGSPNQATSHGFTPGKNIATTSAS